MNVYENILDYINDATNADDAAECCSDALERGYGAAGLRDDAIRETLANLDDCDLPEAWTDAPVDGYVVAERDFKRGDVIYIPDLIRDMLRECYSGDSHVFEAAVKAFAAACERVAEGTGETDEA